MDVTRLNFKELFPIIEKEIEECEYLSIDCEFSGIGNAYSNYFDTAEERYLKKMSNEMKYDIIQFGLSLFKKEENGDGMKCTCYNFYIFKYHVKNSILYDHKMNVSSSAFEFLSINSFDFNKLFKHGITYCNLEEEQYLKASIKRKDQELLLNGRSDYAKLKIIHETLVEYNEFLNDSKRSDLVLGPFEKFKVYLIKETIQNAEKNRRNSPETNLGLKSNGLDLDIQICKEKNTKFWNLKVMKQEENSDEVSFNFNYNDIAEESLGFSKIIQSIIHFKKPLVGHNVLLDLMHIIHQFVAPLPSNYEDFKFIAKELFPLVFDTKHISVFLSNLKNLKGNSKND